MTAVSVHVLTVDADGDGLADLLADAGLTVSGPAGTSPPDLATAIAQAPGADVVCVVGDYGHVSRLAAAFVEALDSRLPGYGEALRRARAEAASGEAVLLRAEAGLVGSKVVFGVPAGGDAQSAAAALVVAAAKALPESEEAAAPEPIPFGGARGSSVGLAVSENREPDPSPEAGEDEDEPTPPGWKRAVESLGAEILVGRREELPEPIEKLAPVLNVLHTAGETGMMKLPSGRRYSLWGWPDLQRPTSKVLAVSWGEPLAEVVALHRHPAEAGTCIEEGNGLLSPAGSDVAEISRKITGRAPPGPDGTLFAISGEAVWILRSRRVIKWDGSKEKDDGNPKQVLSSLTLHWSNR